MTTGPLPRPGRTGVRITGDYYQWLLAWQGCVTGLHDHALRATNPIIAVGVEVDDVGNLDDVVFWRLTPPHSYRQVKYAVDARTPINTEYLTSPSPSGGPSILKKIGAAYIDLMGNNVVADLAIVTNRAPDAADALIAGRDARTKLLMPTAAEQTSRSARGQTRTAWAQNAGLTEEQLLDLLSVLRFDTAKDLTDVELTTSLLMQVTGLRADPVAVHAGADWVAQQVRDGRRKLDIDMIKESVKELDLRQGPSRAVLSVATLKADPLADQAVHTIDWHERFAGPDAYAKRRPDPPATWQQLQDDIEEVPERIGFVHQVVVTGSLRQATAFMIGASLRMVTSVDLAVTQRHQLWSSADDYDRPLEPLVTEYSVNQGNDLAFAVEVSTRIADDVLAYIRDQQLPVGRLITVQPPTGPKDNSIPDPSTANALAVGIRDQARRAAKGHDRIHLFLAGPMGLAILLGHRWNRVATTLVYEEVLADVQYDMAFTVNA